MSTNNGPPQPSNESGRTKAVLDQELDYTETHRALADLTELAARVAGTDISLVNLIDSYTQWSISSFGIDLTQMPREESVCQYTILQDDAFEVKNLAEDERFSERPYVSGGPSLRYYYGVPLKSDGFNLGALCVLDRSAVELSETQRQMMELIAKAVVRRLELMRTVRTLQSRLRSVGHDIRSPLFGIIGLSEIALDNVKNKRTDELEELLSGIHDAGKAILDLAEGILDTKERRRVAVDVSHLPFNEFLTVGLLDEKLDSLYQPQAQAKGVDFTIESAREDLEQAFPKDKVMQILGNLISNSIKFTPEGGKVSIKLDYESAGDREGLHVRVEDNGRGMTTEEIASLGKGGVESREGTSGERGFGYGIAMVQRLIGELKGNWNIESTPGEGTRVSVHLPI